MDESIVKVFEQQQVGKLKLSEAIRIGARMRPDCRVCWGDGVGSCALLAAAEATGMSYKAPRDGPIIRAHLDRKIPDWRDADNAFSMAHDGFPDNEGMTISHHHYIGTMTREQIADWLEARGY